MVDKLMGMEVDATPSCVGYYGQEFLVDRFFAFLNVLPIFFGLFVDFRGLWSGNAPDPCVAACVSFRRVTLKR